MNLLVAVVETVVVVLPLVVLQVHVVVIDVVAHVAIGEDVLELRVVAEGNGREWVEVVGVHLLSLSHRFHLGILSGLLLTGRVGFVSTEVKSSADRVDKEVGAPAHLAEGAQSV